MRARLAATLILGVVTLACAGDLTSSLGNSTSESTPATVLIVPPTSTDIIIGTSVSLTIAVKNATGNDISGLSVVWSSSDPSVATISPSGLLTAVKVGTATITGAVGSKSASVVITVKPVPVAKVALTFKTPIFPGETSPASATPQDAGGNALSGRTVAWTSSEPGIASVNGVGLITGVAFGAATITATVEGVSASSIIIVNVPPVSSVTVSLSAPSVNGTGTVTATAVLKDAFGNTLSNRAIAWSSSSPGVATVSSSGTVTAVGEGSTTITATSEGKSASATFTVLPLPVGSITVVVATQILKGHVATATASVRDTKGNVITRPVTWSSSNSAVATVSADGTVTGLSTGTTSISATAEGVTGSASVIIAQPPLSSVVVGAPSTILQPTVTTQATAAPTDADGNAFSGGGTVTWQSSNSAVATVSGTGLVTAVAAGSAQITATVNGISGSVSITVPAVATVSLAAPSTTRQPSQTTQVTATLLDGSGNAATHRTVSWSSSSTGVATVSSSGLVTAIAAGSTTITATSEGISATLTITVPPVATVSLSTPSPALVVAQTTQVSASLLDGGGNAATNRAIAWSSGTPGVATVSSSGLVTAVALGASVITATSEGKTGTITISVVPPVGSIQLTGAPSSMYKGDAAQLSALILDTFGNPVSTFTPVWTSSNTATAIVTSGGLAKAVGVGTLSNVTFSVSAGGVTRTTPAIAIIGHPLETAPELPRAYVNTAMPAAPAAGHSVISVANGANLQTVLNNAQPGDVIELAAGATFTGTFQLPNKTGSDWIVIRPSNYASLPAEGTRMTPAVAASLNLPKIMANFTQAAVQPLAGAHHYRFVGIEFGVAPSVTQNFNLVSTEAVGGQTTVADTPHDLTFDRVYIHGSATGLLRRCLAMNSASTAIVDSYLSDCHDAGQDAQAIASWNGPGPFKIVNNYLEGSTENLLFGGSDPSIPGLVPSDIEIRRNHIYKPPAWKGVWLAKTLLEIKNAQRVLFEGNVLENSWEDGQTGFAMVLWSANQGGSAPQSTASDITLQYNYITNVGAGISIAASAANVSNLHARRYNVHDNVIIGINTGITTGNGRGFQLASDIQDITIAHNTVMSPTLTAVTFTGSPASVRTSIRDNILHAGTFGLVGDGVSGLGALALHAPDGTLSANLFVYPVLDLPGNFHVSAVSGIGFVNFPTDLTLSGSSAFRASGTDGTSLGADISAVMSAIAGVSPIH